MARFVVAMPVPQEVRSEGPAAAGEVVSRMDEFVASRKRLGVTRERGWLQETPAGDIFLLMLEGNDPIGSNRRFAASTHQFDVWFKQRFGALMGADFAQPIPVHPDHILATIPEGHEAKESIAFAVPLLPGKAQAFRKMADDINGPRRESFAAFNGRAGVLGDWWIEPTPDGELALFYLESDDMRSAFTHLASSKDDEEMWFKQALLNTTGVDYEAPPPPLPELVFDWRV